MTEDLNASGEQAAPVPPPAETSTPSAAPSRPGVNWGVLAFVVAVAAFFVSITSWVQSNRAVDTLAAAQRNVAAAAPAGNPAIIDLSGASMLGPEDAVVTLVEFSDYECPFCIRHFQQTMPQLVANYIKPGKIRYAFRDWPVDQLHPQSIRAHEAANCALEQNRFWDLHPRLFGPPGSHSPEQLLTLARGIGLDMPTFNACIGAKRSDEAIRATGQIAVDFGASGTPAFFIGIRDRATNKVTVTRGLAGAQPYDSFVKVIDEVLAAVK